MTSFFARVRKLSLPRLGQALYNAVLCHLPGRFASKLRVGFLRWCGAQIGQDVRLGPHGKVLGPQSLRLQDHVSVAHGVTLDARGGLGVNRGALIGFESVILTFTHRSQDTSIPVHWQGAYSGAVEIGQNAWLGARCLVLPGSKIGGAAVVGALSVVARDVPAGVVAAGQPAVTVRER